MSRDTEYESLRQEILQLSSGQFNLTSFAVTVGAALIGYGLTSGKALIFLVPLLVFALVLVQLVRCLYSSLLIASYIRLFIEPEKEGLDWETYIHLFRLEMSHSKKPIHIRLTTLSYELALGGVGLVCIILAFAHAEGYELPISVAAAVLWLLLWIMIHSQVNYAVSGRLEQEFNELWPKVADRAHKPTENG